MPADPKPDFTTSFPGRDFSDLGDDRARRLLQMGLVQAFRPVDTLVDKLLSPGGNEWFRRTLAGPPFTSDPALAGGQSLLTGRVMLTQLVKLKEASKSQARDADQNARLAARAGYDLAIVAALVHYGHMITSQRKSELGMALGDLAEALPEPWAGLVSAAIERLGSPPGEQK
jgi:hypothetical protein